MYGGDEGRRDRHDVGNVTMGVGSRPTSSALRALVCSIVGEIVGELEKKLGGRFAWKL